MQVSRLHLPKLETTPRTVFDYLTARFPHIPPPAWRDRFERGTVTSDDGTHLPIDAPYTHGVTIHYEREVLDEPDIEEAETILFQNSEILVADKPHGMPVTPAGNYVRRCLLYRLQAITGIGALVPVHRLDRDTAGLVLFSLNSKTRGQYHQLFAGHEIVREYAAIAHLPETASQGRWHVENRIAAGDPWFRQRIVEGPVNAVTAIELLDNHEGRGHFRLQPHTGKKHQLRLHMASIGAPIEGDLLYPHLRHGRPEFPPLQLLARRLSFVDPSDGAARDFMSQRTLKLRH